MKCPWLAVVIGPSLCLPFSWRARPARAQRGSAAGWRPVRAPTHSPTPSGSRVPAPGGTALAIVRRFLDAHVTGDFAAMTTLLAPKLRFTTLLGVLGKK